MSQAVPGSLTIDEDYVEQVLGITFVQFGQPSMKYSWSNVTNHNQFCEIARQHGGKWDNSVKDWTFSNPENFADLNEKMKVACEREGKLSNNDVTTNFFQVLLSRCLTQLNKMPSCNFSLSQFSHAIVIIKSIFVSTMSQKCVQKCVKNSII